MSSKTTTTQESNPPPWTKAGYELSGEEALRLYKEGSGGNPFMGSTVADLSDTTMSGVNQLANAGQAWDTSGTRDLFGQAGAAAVSNPYMDQLSKVAGNVSADKVRAGNVTTEGDYRDIYSRAQNPSAAEQYLTSMAQGNDLGGNPYYEDAMQGQLDKAAASVNSSMAGAGRYGSGAHTGVLAGELGNIRSTAFANQWNQDQQNRLAATGMIDQGRQGNLGAQLAAMSGATGVQTGNVDRRMMADVGNADRKLSAQGLQGSLLSNAGNMYSTGIGQGLQAASGMADLDQRNFENQLTGANATLEAGGILDDYAQRLRTDEVSKYYELDGADWQRLGMLQAANAGAAGPYGTQNGTSRTSNPAAILGGLGGLMGGKG